MRGEPPHCVASKGDNKKHFGKVRHVGLHLKGTSKIQKSLHITLREIHTWTLAFISYFQILCYSWARVSKFSTTSMRYSHISSLCIKLRVSLCISVTVRIAYISVWTVGCRFSTIKCTDDVDHFSRWASIKSANVFA